MTGEVLSPPADLEVDRAPDLGTESPHRIVLIDPRDERRAITCRVVEGCTQLTVVGSVAGLAEAELQIRTERADLALLEIQMPVEQGLEAVAALRQHFPHLRIVVCSFHGDRATREAARLHGADGYLTKPLEVADLLALAATSPLLT
jgi:DNA-binding NarL/FixJ family response regulator